MLDQLGATARIGILGHCGNVNLGDEATIAAVIQNIRKRYPDSSIFGFTINPEGTEKQHGIPSFALRRRTAKHQPRPQYETFFASSDEPDRSGPVVRKLKHYLKRLPWVYNSLKRLRDGVPGFLHCWQEPTFLIDSYKTLRELDLLVIAGSHQLMDYSGGPWGFPYTLYKWVLMAKLARVKVAFLSVGAGPLCTWLGRLFAKAALILADYHSFRDESSRLCIEELAIHKQNLVFPDLVFSLQIRERVVEVERGSRPIVGLNPVPFVDPGQWLGADSQTYEDYITKLAQFALWLIQRGYDVLFFPTQLCLDPPVINDIRTSMNELGRGDFAKQIRTVPIHSFDQLVSAIAMMDIVVATRFHGIIFPLLLNKPVLSIAYHRKTVDLMAQMGQSDYVIDIHRFASEELRERFLSLERSVTVVKQELDMRVPRCRTALDQQYERLFELAGAKVA